MGMCPRCTKITGIMFVALGIMFLMKDLGAWNLGGVSWGSAFLLAVGVSFFAKSLCRDCNMLSSGKK